VAFRDVTPERMRRPLSVLVVNWRKIAIALIDPVAGVLSVMGLDYNSYFPRYERGGRICSEI
jgi:hypothetical protein